jgi:hypothetical protein
MGRATLNGIRFLLTYSCTNMCDHCFLHCSPETRGTFTAGQLRRVFAQIQPIPTIETVYFELPDRSNGLERG